MIYIGGNLINKEQIDFVCLDYIKVGESLCPSPLDVVSNCKLLRLIFHGLNSV